MSGSRDVAGWCGRCGGGVETPISRRRRGRGRDVAGGCGESAAISRRRKRIGRRSLRAGGGESGCCGGLYPVWRANGGCCGGAGRGRGNIPEFPTSRRSGGAVGGAVWRVPAPGADRTPAVVPGHGAGVAGVGAALVRGLRRPAAGRGAGMEGGMSTKGDLCHWCHVGAVAGWRCARCGTTFPRPRLANPRRFAFVGRRLAARVDDDANGCVGNAIRVLEGRN